MASVIKCKFCEPVTDNFSILRSYLPTDYEYLVCSLSANNTNFKARLRTDGKNQDHAHKWLEEFQMHTKCTMRVERTYPHSGTKNVFKIDLRCQHNTRPRNEKVREKESCKNTDCPAKMGITIKRVVTERKSRSKDPHLPAHPTVIQINFCHNHDILTPEILKHRSVLPEVKEKLLSLFKLGHNPATALDMHKYDLLLEHGENFEKICHDRALLPDSQFCYRLYYKIVRKQAECPAVKAKAPLSNCENSSVLNSKASSVEVAKKKRKLENALLFDDPDETTRRISAEMYKFCRTGGIAGMLKVDEKDSVMALCTPLMLRVHSFLRHSAELAFVDSYGELDGEPSGCRVYLFLTYSAVGAIPVGCVVTTSTTAACIGAALDLWKQILPREGFFGRGERGPELIFAGDGESERRSLRSAFPGSRLLVCLSHLLRASWTFLVDRKNTIKKEHRSLFFSRVKMLLFSQTAEELELNYSYAAGDELVRSNALFLEHLNHVYERRHDWSLVYCRHLLPASPSSDALFWESATVVPRDPVLSRARTFNPLQVLDFLSRLDTYYERRLIDLANERFDSVRLSRFLLVDLPREAYTITQFSEIEYEVHNDAKDTAHQVDVSLGVCECRAGRTGAPCKHQLLVLRNFSVPVYDCVPPNTPSERDVLFLLATGYPESSSPSKAADPAAVQEATTTPPPAQHPKSLCMGMQATDIVIHDLDPCAESSAFFLDENLNPSLSGQQPSPLVDLASDSHPLVQAPSVLEQQQPPPPPQQQHSPSAAQDSMQNLLSQLDDEPRQPLSSGSGGVLVQVSSSPDDPQVVSVLDRICAELKDRASRSPATFRPALNTFLRNLEGLGSDSSLEHALYSFGKFSKSATPLFRRKVADDKLIGLQSTGELKKRKKQQFRRRCSEKRLLTSADC